MGQDRRKHVNAGTFPVIPEVMTSKDMSDIILPFSLL